MGLILLLAAPSLTVAVLSIWRAARARPTPIQKWLEYPDAKEIERMLWRERV